LLGAVLFAVAPPPSARAQDIGAELKHHHRRDRSHFRPVTLGNVVGGAGFVGFVCWAIYRKGLATKAE